MTNVSSSSLKRRWSSSDLQGQKSGSPGLILFEKDGSYALYNPKEGKIERNLGDFSGCRLLANSGNCVLLLDSGSNLYIKDVFSEKKISLPSLDSIMPCTSSVKRVGDRGFVRKDSDCTFTGLTCDDVRGLLWVSESGKEFVVVWLFDRPGHPYISFCRKGDTHYTDISLFFRDSHWLDGLSFMVVKGYRLYISTNRRYVRILDLSGEQGTFKDMTGFKPFSMLSDYDLWDSSIAVSTSGELLLVESDPCDRTCFRVYKNNPDIQDPFSSSYSLLDVDSLGGEALLLDLGITVPANPTLGIEPDSIYFTRHYRPCQCTPRDLDICVFNLATKTLQRFPHLSDMNLMDARWFLPRN
ncbi:F-box protein [Cardamine amara subsp. amara]|uniref:F-box protein n=1 Tax=Cardamine amara subsp. amara TaxID=228776 RepID=A0ABD1A533_CARAN